MAGRLTSPITVTVELDWARRFDHMQQHTAQHLLTAVAADRFGWPTTAFHLGEHVSDVELDVAAIDEEQLRSLENAVAAEVRAARPVTARRVSRDEYERTDVRSRGLPAGHAGDVRLVEIDGVDRDDIVEVLRHGAERHSGGSSGLCHCARTLLHSPSDATGPGTLRTPPIGRGSQSLRSAEAVGAVSGVLDLDLDVDAGREFDPLERVDGLGVRVHDVDQPLVDPHLEVLA